MRIYIADDDPVSRIMLKAILEKAGYVVEAGEDGGQALAALSLPDAPRLAVLDVMMPVLDGVEVCRRLRALPEGDRRYLIMLTTSNRPENVEAGLAAGANDYVGKPFVRRDLLARVRVGEKMIELREALTVRETELAKVTTDHINSLREALAHLHALTPDPQFSGFEAALKTFEAAAKALGAVETRVGPTT